MRPTSLLALPVSVFMVSCSPVQNSGQNSGLQSKEQAKSSALSAKTVKFKCGDSRSVEISKSDKADTYSVVLKRKGVEIFSEKLAAVVSSNISSDKGILSEIEQNMRYLTLQGQDTGARIEFVSGLIPSGWFRYTLSTLLTVNDDEKLRTEDCVLQSKS